MIYAIIEYDVFTYIENQNVIGISFIVSFIDISLSSFNLNFFQHSL